MNQPTKRLRVRPALRKKPAVRGRRNGRPLTLNFNDPTLDRTEMETRVTCWDAGHIHRGPSGDRDYAAETRMNDAFRRMFGSPSGKLPTSDLPVGVPTIRKRRSR